MNGQRQFVRIAAKTRGNQSHNHWRQNNSGQSCQAQDNKKMRENHIHKIPHRGFVFLMNIFGKNRHHRRVRRPLSHQVPKEIGDTKRHEKGVRRGLRSKQFSQNDIPDKSQDA